jgi:phage shock protein PspC (stress-responsive transcriptional regulator)
MAITDWRMRAGTRRWFLLTHVVCSVGWVGIELALLTLGLIGQFDSDPVVTRSVHIVAGILGGIFYFPAAALTLISGVLLGLGTKWGLVRYHWVLVKLAFNVALLIGGSFLVIPAFEIASEAAIRNEPIGDTSIMMVSAMTAGLTLLLIATQLSIFKPWPKTRWYPKKVASKVSL